MKLRGKILCLVLLPLVVLGALTYVIGSIKIDSAMTGAIKTGLKSTAYSVRDTISLGSEGEYWVDENNELWKGKDLNLSQNQQIADHVSDETNTAVTVFFGDTRYMTSVKKDDGTRVIGTQAAPEVIEKVLKGGESYFAEHVMVAGEEYFAFYLPLYDDSQPAPVGMVFTGISQKNADREINQILNTLLGVLVAIIIVCSVLVSIIIGKIVAVIGYGVDQLKQVAKGDLTITIDEKRLKRKDEVGSMLRAVSLLRQELLNVIKAIVTKSSEVNLASETLKQESIQTVNTVEEVSKAVNELAKGATAQAEKTKKATEQVVYMGNMVETTNEEVMGLHANASEMQKSGDRAREVLNELDTINEKTREYIQAIYEQTNTTNESVLRIQEVTAIITSIAEETNLLALNASIEAARAGQEGRGFAVVADQIQKLAEQSNASAHEIETVVDLLIQNSQRAVGTMDGVKQVIEEQSQRVSMTEENFRKVMDGIAQSVVGIDSISDSTRKLDSIRKDVVSIVENLTNIAEGNACTTEETFAAITEVTDIIANISDSAKELKNIADELGKTTTLFIFK